MEDESTASSSRRSAKLRERSSGSVSSSCVYSARIARECAVDNGDVELIC